MASYNGFVNTVEKSRPESQCQSSLFLRNILLGIFLVPNSDFPCTVTLSEDLLRLALTVLFKRSL